MRFEAGGQVIRAGMPDAPVLTGGRGRVRGTAGRAARERCAARSVPAARVQKQCRHQCHRAGAARSPSGCPAGPADSRPSAHRSRATTSAPQPLCCGRRRACCRGAPRTGRRRRWCRGRRWSTEARPANRSAPPRHRLRPGVYRNEAGERQRQDDETSTPRLGPSSSRCGRSSRPIHAATAACDGSRPRSRPRACHPRGLPCRDRACVTSARRRIGSARSGVGHGASSAGRAGCDGRRSRRRSLLLLRRCVVSRREPA